MERWIFNLLALASLALCAASASTYLRTGRADRFTLCTNAGDYYAIEVWPRGFSFDWSYQRSSSRHWKFEHRKSWMNLWQLAPTTLWNRLGFWGGFTGATVLDDGTYQPFRQFLLPAWAVSVLFALLPGYWIMQTIRRKRSVIAGLCLHCGYDLRASPDRCPECGAVTPTKPSKPSAAVAHSNIRH